MNIKDRASAIRRLLEDESFQWLFESVSSDRLMFSLTCRLLKKNESKHTQNCEHSLT